MAEETIGGRPVTITKDGDKVKIVFHPAAKNAKHPKAALFTITLSNADLAKIDDNSSFLANGLPTSF